MCSLTELPSSVFSWLSMLIIRQFTSLIEQVESLAELPGGIRTRNTINKPYTATRYEPVQQTPSVTPGTGDSLSVCFVTLAIMQVSSRLPLNMWARKPSLLQPVEPQSTGQVFQPVSGLLLYVLHTDELYSHTTE